VIDSEDMSIADYTKILEWNKNMQFRSIEIMFNNFFMKVICLPNPWNSTMILMFPRNTVWSLWGATLWGGGGVYLAYFSYVICLLQILQDVPGAQKPPLKSVAGFFPGGNATESSWCSITPSCAEIKLLPLYACMARRMATLPYLYVTKKRMTGSITGLKF